MTTAPGINLTRKPSIVIEDGATSPGGSRGAPSRTSTREKVRSRLNAKGTQSLPNLPTAPALTKPEAQKILHAESKLRPFENEKMNVCYKNTDDLYSAFERARLVRQQLQDEYAARNRLVISNLQEIKQITDTEARKYKASLKTFAEQYEANMAEKKVIWEDACKKGFEELHVREQALGKHLDTTHSMIQKEAGEMEEHLSNATNNLLEQLRAHRATLKAIIAERAAGHEDYQYILEDKMQRLLARLKKETQIRSEACAKTLAETKVKAVVVEEELLKEKASVKSRFEEIESKIEVEGKDRIKSQKDVVENMQQFFDICAENVAIANKKLGESQSSMMNMQRRRSSAY
eukprot:gnl/TRDRNA2_/TRDRNA2_184012_c0_seq1.p1 gnl/TRDRNA2_/TRDRNA2_184012_c0~~gnl/TRDRNA2_/TRDRNA2_184012_c0_seq1.p1  ORF type:complete len:348 (-),score=84.03 gnl/TRDRNA2_/TRDRNA2_184012_c0_seq1:95-1138(-)